MQIDAKMANLSSLYAKLQGDERANKVQKVMLSYQRCQSTLTRAIEIRAQIEAAHEAAMTSKKAPEGWTPQTFAVKQRELVEVLKQGQLLEGNAREMEKALEVVEQDAAVETQKLEDQ